MKSNTAVVVVGAAVLALLGGQSVASPLASESARRAELPGGFVRVSSPDRQDDAIRRAFQDVLKREPTESELRRYRGRMEEDGWSEEDVRNNLQTRSDYRRFSGGHDSEVDLVVRRAYEDILNRQPDPQGLREYRSAMVDSRQGLDRAGRARRPPEEPRVREPEATVRRPHHQARVPGHARARARPWRFRELPRPDRQSWLGRGRCPRGAPEKPGVPFSGTR